VHASQSALDFPPISGLYVPAGQSVTLALAVPQYAPAGHALLSSVGAYERPAGQYIPAGQALVSIAVNDVVLLLQ
jgi:hypothetical protein